MSKKKQKLNIGNKQINNDGIENMNTEVNDAGSVDNQVTETQDSAEIVSPIKQEGQDFFQEDETVTTVTMEYETETEESPAVEGTETTIGSVEGNENISAAPAVLDTPSIQPTTIVVEEQTTLTTEAEDMATKQTQTAAVPNPAIASTVQASVVDTQSIPLDAFDEKIKDLKLNGTPAQKSMISTLENYIREMKPGKSIYNPGVGARLQYNLWRMISSIIHDSPDEFKTNWNLLLAFFEKHKDGVFHDHYINRFTEAWAWSEDDSVAFQQLAHLIKHTANRQTRQKNIKTINLPAALSKGLTEEGRQRLVMFYTT